MGGDSRYVSCVLCQKDETEVFVKGEGSAQVLKCQNDGLLYRNPRPTAGELNAFQKEFVAEADPEWFVQRGKALRKAAEAIESVKRGGTLLDIGCATGNFFENFNHGSWRFYGLDTSPLGIEMARAKYQAEVFCGILREAHYPAGFFDVVTVMDALYYSPDPRADLSEMHRILKDDGLLAVEIPGHRAMVWREKGLLCWLLEGKWERLFARPEILYFFAPSTINLLLRASGFRLLRTVPGSSVSMRKWGQALHKIYFALAWLVFKVSAGKCSIAGRELYLAVKQ
jgi:SAM-dependent methyltransferase